MESHGEVGQGFVSYLMVFFAIWWAWMNFTWFATAFDSDDWLYRLLTIFQMGGVLVLASGVEAAMTEHDFTRVTWAYVLMRLAMVAQWLRVAASNPDYRGTALRYAAGIVVVQVGWVARLALPGAWGVIGFLVLVVAEVAVPIWSERRVSTPWHPHHITERYSLFTLILLGESILASANAVVEALDEGHHAVELTGLAAIGLLIAAGLWWVYFSREHHAHITTLGASLAYGYVHYFIFAGVGAFSAGVEVLVGRVAAGDPVPDVAATVTLVGPVAVFLVGLWALVLRPTLTGLGHALYWLGVVLVGCGLFGTPLLGGSLVCVGVAACVVAVSMPLLEVSRV
jgi:low temperature requirement protein LtrA